MVKSILVYFKSENDAEAARSGLQRLRVSDIYLDHLPDGDTKNTYVSIDTALSTEADKSEVVKSGGVFSNLFGKKEEPMTHIVQAKIQDEDYEAAMNVLTKGNGYIEQ